MTWLSDAACRGSGIDFYQRINPQMRRACASCTVTTECLTDALEADRRDIRATGRCYGFRAGLGAHQRALMIAGECRWCGFVGEGQECGPCRAWPLLEERRWHGKTFRMAS